MPKKDTTWVLVADGRRARVLASKGAGQGFDLVAERETRLERSHDLGTDRPGRAYESGTTGRHAIEPRVDFHREQKVAFVRTLVDLLSEGLKGDRFQKLVLVAPPAALGDLRRLMDDPLRKRVSAEVDKDLTKIELHDLPDHLRDVVRC